MPHRWSDVRRLLEEALEHPEPERDAWITEAACGDVDLAAEVRRLLHQELPSEDFLLPPPPHEEALREAPRWSVGMRIGAYRLVELVAAGGMGRVFRAERADESFEKCVAIKVLDATFQAPRALESFQREQQLLARLEHPGVTRLLDGGTTSEGWPYLVMEFVEGIPITTFASRNDLNRDERLGLFQQVCDAVAYAHRHLIVHRDLKPANVLVKQDGFVKLVDFGISKLLEHDPASGWQAHATSHQMTLGYASPEQIRGEVVATTGDVYSLGALLCELLTDSPLIPLALSLPEAVNAICDGTSGVATEDEELDAIVLKAAAPDAAARYPSVEALSEDIERYRQGLPVRAHPPTRFYLLRKGLARHGKLIGGMALAFFTTLAFALGLAKMNTRLVAQRAAATAASQRESHARREAEQLNDFLLATFELADPLYARGDGFSVLDLLGQASERLQALDLGAATEAVLRVTLGSAYLQLHRVDDAAPHLFRGVELLRGVAGRDADLARALGSLAAVHLWNSDPARAETARREALELSKESPAEVRIARQRDLAHAVALQGRWQEAESLCERALQGAHEPHIEVVRTMEALAHFRAQQNRAEKLEELERDALAMRAMLFGERSPEYAAGLQTWASIQGEAGGYSTAATRAREAVDLLIELSGADHASTLDARILFGFTLIGAGRVAEAQEELQLALSIAEANLPEWHGTLAHVRGRLGALLLESGDFESAEPLLLAAHSAQSTMAGPENIIALQLRELIAHLYERWGKPELALSWGEMVNSAAGE